MTTTPWIIRKDGMLLDRKSEIVIGRVWLDRELGWCADGPEKRHTGAIGRKYAARWAYEEWEAAIRRTVSAASGTLPS